MPTVRSRLPSQWGVTYGVAMNCRRSRAEALRVGRRQRRLVGRSLISHQRFWPDDVM